MHVKPTDNYQEVFSHLLRITYLPIFPSDFISHFYIEGPTDQCRPYREEPTPILSFDHSFAKSGQALSHLKTDQPLLVVLCCATYLVR